MPADVARLAVFVAPLHTINVRQLDLLEQQHKILQLLEQQRA